VISSNLSGVTAGSYGDATHIPQINVSPYGRILSASSVEIPVLDFGRYEPTWTWVSGGSGTPIFREGIYQRVGSVVQVTFRISALGASTSASGTISVPIEPVNNFGPLSGIGFGTAASTNTETTTFILGSNGTKVLSVNISSTSGSNIGSFTLYGTFNYRLDD
jgi:hypothetical protein